MWAFFLSAPCLFASVLGLQWVDERVALLAIGS